MEEEDDGFDINISEGGGEYVFPQTNGGNDEMCDDVIVISDDEGDDVDVDGSDSDDDDYFDGNAPGTGDLEAYEEYMRRRLVIGPSIRNFERYTYEEYMRRSPIIGSSTENLLTNRLMSVSTTTATAAATTTTTTTTAQT